MQKLSIGRVIHVCVNFELAIWRPAIVVDVQATSFTATVFPHPGDRGRPGCVEWLGFAPVSVPVSPDFLIESSAWRWPPRE